MNISEFLSFTAERIELPAPRLPPDPLQFRHFSDPASDHPYSFPSRCIPRLPCQLCFRGRGGQVGSFQAQQVFPGDTSWGAGK